MEWQSLSTDPWERDGCSHRKNGMKFGSFAQKLTVGCLPREIPLHGLDRLDGFGKGVPK